MPQRPTKTAPREKPFPPGAVPPRPSRIDREIPNRPRPHLHNAKWAERLVPLSRGSAAGRPRRRSADTGRAHPQIAARPLYRDCSHDRRASDSRAGLAACADWTMDAHRSRSRTARRHAHPRSGDLRRASAPHIQYGTKARGAQIHLGPPGKSGKWGAQFPDQLRASLPVPSSNKAYDPA